MKLTIDDIRRIAKETEERETRMFMRLISDEVKELSRYLDSCAFGDWDDDGFPGDR